MLRPSRVAACTTRMELSLDPNLLQRQREFEDLLKNTPTDARDIERMPSSLLGDISVAGTYRTAAIWLIDGINARSIEFPRNDRQLTYLGIYRSRWLRALFNFFVFLQIFAPLFEQSYCGLIPAIDVHHLFFYPNGQPSRLSLTILDLMCLAVYGFDLFMAFGINPNKKSFVNKPWSTFRLVCCFLLAADCLAYFAKYSQPRLIRCIFPFFFISRRNNLKLMMQGLFTSAYHSMPIIKGVVSVLFLWGFVGYFLFQRLNESGHRFDSPGQGIFTCLHSFTSRPFVLRVLNPFYATNEASTIFFVTLTLAADLLCINLVVATGNRQYKAFVSRILKKRLSDRKFGLQTSFRAMSATVPSQSANSTDEVTVITKKNWMKMCKTFQSIRSLGYTSISRDTAAFIFALEDKEELGYVDEMGYFRMCAMVAAKVTINTTVVPENDVHLHPNSSLSTRKGPVGGAGGSVKSLRYDEDEDEDDDDDDGVDEHDHGSSVGDKSRKSTMSAIICDDNTKSNSSVNPMLLTNLLANSHNTADEDTASDKADTLGSKLKASLGRKTSTSGVTGRENRVHSRMSEVLVVQANDRPILSSVEDMYEQMARLVGSTVARLLSDAVWFSRMFLNTHMTFRINSEIGGFKLGIYPCISTFVHLLLLIQLCFVSRDDPNVAWFRFGFVLESLFWFFMLVQLTAYGHKCFFSSKENRVDTIINVTSLIIIACVGESAQHGLTIAFVFMLIVQSLRLFKLFFVVNDISVFVDILPILVRAGFIYFSVIYFFAIFAHVFFCNSLSETAVLNATGDDDSSTWVGFSNLLNFDTIWQAVFTMFELSLLANWSIVPDAIVVSGLRNVVGTYIFFYFFRLTMTLMILPILIAFIMQSFISAIGRKEERAKYQAMLAHQQLQRDQDALDNRDKAMMHKPGRNDVDLQLAQQLPQHTHEEEMQFDRGSRVFAPGQRPSLQMSMVSAPMHRTIALPDRGTGGPAADQHDNENNEADSQGGRHAAAELDKRLSVASRPSSAQRSSLFPSAAAMRRVTMGQLDNMPKIKIEFGADQHMNSNPYAFHVNSQKMTSMLSIWSPDGLPAATQSPTQQQPVMSPNNTSMHTDYVKLQQQFAELQAELAHERAKNIKK